MIIPLINFLHLRGISANALASLLGLTRIYAAIGASEEDDEVETVVQSLVQENQERL